MCDLLTPTQRAELETDPATETTSVQNGAYRCRWQTLGGTGFLMVTSATELTVGGLEALYLTRDTFGVFEPGELDGYPIVRADREDSGDGCTIYVGVADDQLILATVGFSLGDRSACAVARQMASFMISNLPPLR